VIAARPTVEHMYRTLQIVMLAIILLLFLVVVAAAL
jgi:hypothetical protein